MKKLQAVSISGLGVIGMLLTTGAIAQDDDPVITYRQKVMDVNGASLGAIGDILKFKLPYEKDIAGHAQAISISARMIATAFKKDVSEGKTDAKPEIWTDWDKFEDDANKLAAASDKLADVAGSGDIRQIVAQVKQVGEACKSCHEDFRKPKEESFRNKQ